MLEQTNLAHLRRPCLAAILTVWCGVQPCDAAAPNVVFVLADDK